MFGQLRCAFCKSWAWSMTHRTFFCLLAPFVALFLSGQSDGFSIRLPACGCLMRPVNRDTTNPLMVKSCYAGEESREYKSFSSPYHVPLKCVSFFLLVIAASIVTRWLAGGFLYQFAPSLFYICPSELSKTFVFELEETSTFAPWPHQKFSFNTTH